MMYFNNLDKKLVVNRFYKLVSRYYMLHAQKENIKKLAEPTSNTKDWQEKEI